MLSLENLGDSLGFTFSSIEIHALEGPTSLIQAILLEPDPQAIDSFPSALTQLIQEDHIFTWMGNQLKLNEGSLVQDQLTLTMTRI